jgi:Ca2+-dependent lipid-binding protein
VIINCHGQNFKTNVKSEAGKYPVWNQNFTINITSMNEEISFEVMDRDTFSKDDLIGRGYARVA